MNQFRHFIAWSIRCAVLAVLAVSTTGCNYSGVGNLTISDNAEQIGQNGASQKLFGTFDRYFSRKDGDVYTVVAYQRVKSPQAFGHYYRNYRRDAHFVQAELIVRFNKNGEVIGQPRLVLLQGDRILTDGPLNGELAVKIDGNDLNISGESMMWQYSDSMPIAVSFELALYNVLGAPVFSDA